MEIAIISGKGGTGKSSISAALANRTKPVVLADCDVDAANLHLLFQPIIHEEGAFVSGQKAVIDKSICNECGICIDYCRFDAIHELDGVVLIDDITCDGCELCARICPVEAISMIEEDDSRLYAGDFRYGKMVFGRLAPGEENSGRLVDLVRKKAKDISKGNGIEHILIDGPPGIGCPVISSITGVDKVIVVTEPTVSGLHDLKRTLKITDGHKLSTQVIINKYDLNTILAAQIEAYCSEQQVPLIAKIPFDPLMVEAMVHAQTVAEYAPDSEIAKIIRDLQDMLFE